MRFTALIFLTSVLLTGCNQVSSSMASEPKFELRDFVVAEDKTEATEYSKAWNSFKGTGTLIARNVSPDRNMLVWLEARDTTTGANSEPNTVVVLFRGGVGKVEVSKSNYGEMSSRPAYQWSVLGWQELNKATITTDN